MAYTKGCSDVHLGVEEEPRFRNRGDIVPTGWPVTDQLTFMTWLKDMVSSKDLDHFRTEKEFDGSFSFPFVRVRINLFETMRGPSMVMRLIPNNIASLQELASPEVFSTLATKTKGILLVTGPTGSGKSTTLAAIIDHINRTMRRHILTIEDPVEFIHRSKKSLIHQREVGTNTKRFNYALRAAMREDPDVILIGEIRDRDTLATAIEAAQTGHLVLGTLHTNSAVSTLERIVGMVPADLQESTRKNFAEAFLAVIAQGLIRTIDKQRVSYHEILISNDACKDYILRGKLDDVEQIMARSNFAGMQTINQSLAKLVQQNRVTEDEAISHSLKPAELRQVLRGRVS